VALAAVLVVIGGKMMAHEWLKSLLGSHFNFYVLGAVASIIGIGVIASLLHRSPTRSAPTAAAGSAKR
jgi:predicted tellurium resistance membrane protein TerC